MIRVVVREMFANRSILTISLQRNLVRENRSQGSVRGDGSNAIPYLKRQKWWEEAQRRRESDDSPKRNRR